jgi:tRNA pseudouridine32 synthase / 23S rRNA pseudouridine746 synthase
VSMPLKVLHQDEHLLVVDKPAGLPCHQEGDHQSVSALLRLQLGRELWPVHRLDRDTSGLLLFACHAGAARELAGQFAGHTIQKTYLALSGQKPGKKQGWIKGDMAKGRNGDWRLLRSQHDPAITRFDTASLWPGYRLFFLYPQTGRTHQLRVALKSLSSPVLGDTRYGGAAADRMYLHAWRLQFVVFGQAYQFECWPESGELWAGAAAPHLQTIVMQNLA